MKSSFYAMFLDNAIVKEHRKRKEKVSYYANNGIAPVLRDEMLLTCVKWYRTCPGSSRKFITKDSRGEKEAVQRTGRCGEIIRKRKRHLQYFTEKEECFVDFLAFAKFVDSN